jgi:hypothetical protein
MGQEWFSGRLEFTSKDNTTTFRLDRLAEEALITLSLRQVSEPDIAFTLVEDIGSSFSIPILALLALDARNAGNGLKKSRIYGIVFENAEYGDAEKTRWSARENENRVEKEITRLRKRIGRKTIRNVRRTYGCPITRRFRPVCLHPAAHQFHPSSRDK